MFFFLLANQLATCNGIRSHSLISYFSYENIICCKTEHDERNQDGIGENTILKEKKEERQLRKKKENIHISV